jgi:microcystin degradation protein MlrC
VTRIAVAGFQHETNTFAPFPTDLPAFERGGAWPPLTRGGGLRDRFRGLNVPLSGFLDACPHETMPILWAGAEPGGYVAADAFDAIAGEIVDGIAAARPDAVYLDLHGAMVTEAHDDAEAELLRRVRAVTGPDLPVAVSLDLHGNLSRALFDRATVVTIYRTYPHLDMAETGARAARLLDHVLRHGVPAGAFRQVDLMLPITAQSTEYAPGHDLYAAVAAAPCLSADMAMGFPPADIPDAGPTVFAYDPDPARAEAAADALAHALLDAEPRFDARLLPAAEAVAQALALPAPVVIADVQDNPGAGGTGDTTGLMRALLDARASDAILSMLFDPEAAKAAHAAGVGTTLTLDLGGHLGAYSAPLRHPVSVEALHDGPFPMTGPFYGGQTADLGPIARLHLQGTGLRVVVGSRRAQNADQAMFRVVGLEPRDHALVCVKSAVHFIGDYKRVTDRILFAVAPGANPCHLPDLPYRRLRPGVRLGPGGPVHGA